MLSQAFNITIDRGIGASVHGREVLYGINAIYKRFILQLMAAVKIPGSQLFDTKIAMHISRHNSDAILSQ